MAVVALQDPNLVWQKVAQALGGQAGTGSEASADPTSQNAFRALKLQMGTQRLNQQLQFFPFGEADVTIAASGFTGPSGAFRLYGVWAKKNTSGVVPSFLTIRNQVNTTYGTGATGVLVALSFSGPGDEAFQINPKGLPFTQTTGSTITASTSILGTTSSSGGATGDGVHGFLILGAP